VDIPSVFWHVYNGIQILAVEVYIYHVLSAHLVLATVPGYPASVWVGTKPKALVWVRNCQATRTAVSSWGCYLDWT